MNKPSKAELKRLVALLQEQADAEGQPHYPDYAADLRSVADILDTLVDGTLKLTRLLNGHSITIRARAGKDNRLYKPIGTPEIITAVTEEFGIGISSRNVVLPELIHELGVFDVKLAFDVTFATIKVWVVQDELKPNEPEKPKVETLREAAERLWARPLRHTATMTDLCAIVLRRVDRLEEILDDATDRKVQLSRDLAKEREINKQLLEGAEA